MCASALTGKAREMKKLFVVMCLMIWIFVGVGSAQGAAGQWEVVPGTEGWAELGFTAQAMWNSSPEDVFVVGNVITNGRSAGNIIFHYTGSDWTQMNSGTQTILNGVWGSSPVDVYVVGCGSTILHYDGTDWLPVDLGITVPFTDYFGVWGSSANDVYVGGQSQLLHFDGASWERIEPYAGVLFYAIWGSAANDVYVSVADQSGSILHFDGTNWSNIGGLGGGVIGKIWGSSKDDVYFLSPYLISRYRPSGWTNPLSELSDFGGIWGSSANDVFIGGKYDVVYHFNGVRWETIDVSQYIAVGIFGGNKQEVFGLTNFFGLLRYVLPPIEVTQPNVRQAWARGSVKPIKWLSSKLGTGRVSIELLKGGVLTRTISLATANDGAYSWTVPTDLPAGSNYKVRITAKTGGEVDESDVGFRID